MIADNTQPNRRLARWMLVAAILLGMASIVMWGLILAGAFDPQPAGPAANEVELIPITVSQGNESLLWVDASAADAHHTAQTWRLTAAYLEGELDSGYGLALGGDDRALVAAVSPAGYTAIWEQDAAGNQTTVWLPWQPWPHVRHGAVSNEIWVDVVPEGARDQVTIRMNRELLWTGQVARLGRAAGTWATTFGDKAAIDFQRLERFDADTSAGSRE